MDSEIDDWISEKYGKRVQWKLMPKGRSTRVQPPSTTPEPDTQAPSTPGNFAAEAMEDDVNRPSIPINVQGFPGA